MSSKPAPRHHVRLVSSAPPPAVVDRLSSTPAGEARAAFALQAAWAREVALALRSQSTLVDAFATANLPPGTVQDAWRAAARIHAGAGERLVEMVDRWIGAFRMPAPVPIRGDD